MSARDDELAFPHNERSADGAHWHSHDGMTLRDYFAAKAMQAGHGFNPDHLNYADRADHAYRMADAMLAARGES